MSNIEIISLSVLVTAVFIMSMVIGYSIGHRDGKDIGYQRGKAVNRHVSAK
ncbi:MAG: hypothetical protein JW384_01725 [Nitrosomonadaceae bacterium]|nr:hypothetical protein [Nitrosomonadaceae bacterium]